jgi:hypothetical protein
VRDIGCDTRVRRGMVNLQETENVDPSSHHVEVLIAVLACPIVGEAGGFEEFFVGILLGDV